MDVVGHVGHVGHVGNVADGIHVDGLVAVDEEVDNTVAVAVDIVGAVALDIVGVVDEEVDNMVSVALVNPEQYWRWVGTAIASRIPHSHSPSRFV
jgi:hypothetical protein